MSLFWEKSSGMLRYTLCSKGWSLRHPSRILQTYRNFSSGNRKYATTHEWIKVEDNVGTVGISKHAAEELGEVVYVDLPEKGLDLEAKSTFGAVESVKAASDVYSPVSGQVLDINSKLQEDPSLINKDSLGEGWLIKLKIQNPKELDQLMDEVAYLETTQEKSSH
ncbi:Glycine cleavage system H protein, mitochondrial [Galdieria sulphuraria]|nr:Glycine cleavage system H protein, mitochondrial [Galdieria sulphuraria]